MKIRKWTDIGQLRQRWVIGYELAPPKFESFLPPTFFFLLVDFHGIVWNGLLGDFKGALIFVAFKTLGGRVPHIATRAYVAHKVKYEEAAVNTEFPGQMHSIRCIYYLLLAQAAGNCALTT